MGLRKQVLKMVGYKLNVIKVKSMIIKTPFSFVRKIKSFSFVLKALVSVICLRILI